MEWFEPGEWERKLLNPDDVSVWLEEPDGLNTLSYLVADKIRIESMSLVDLLKFLSSHPLMEPLLKEPLLGEECTIERTLNHIIERLNSLRQSGNTLRALSLALRKHDSSSQPDGNHEG
jgi:hypothetical protein